MRILVCFAIGLLSACNGDSSGPAPAATSARAKRDRPAQKEEPKPAPAASPVSQPTPVVDEFDPNDAMRTLYWLKGQSGPMVDAINDIGVTHERKKLNDSLKALENQRFTWKLPVENITQMSFAFLPPCTPLNYRDTMKAYGRPESPTAGIFPAFCITLVPEVDWITLGKQPWIHKLRPGDIVVLSGTIESITHRDDWTQKGKPVHHFELRAKSCTITQP